MYKSIWIQALSRADFTVCVGICSVKAICIASAVSFKIPALSAGSRTSELLCKRLIPSPYPCKPTRLRPFLPVFFMYSSDSLSRLTASCSATSRCPSFSKSSTCRSTGSKVGKPSLHHHTSYQTERLPAFNESAMIRGGIKTVLRAMYMLPPHANILGVWALPCLLCSGRSANYVSATGRCMHVKVA